MQLHTISAHLPICAVEQLRFIAVQVFFSQTKCTSKSTQN